MRPSQLSDQYYQVKINQIGKLKIQNVQLIQNSLKIKKNSPTPNRPKQSKSASKKRQRRV